MMKSEEESHASRHAHLHGRLQPSSLGEESLTHVVSSGDTLQSLSLKYGVQPAEIKRLNKLFAPTLFAGTVLKLPAAAARTHIHALPPASAGATQVTITDARPKAEAEWAVGAIPRQAEHTPRVIDTAIIDTATVWDGEAGFMSLTADRDMDKDCGGVAGEDLPCTWVGSLFSPQHDCLLTGLALNLRVVDGESLAFRVIVTEWIPTTLAAAGPAATPPDQGRGTSLHQAQDHVCNAGGGPGAVLFYSRVLHIQRQHAEDPVWARIDDALTQTHGQSVRVPAGQTVLLGVCTECVAQEPPVATASTQGEGVDGQHEVGGSLGQVQVGYVRSRACSEAVGGVLQKLVWLHGCVGGSMPWVVAGGGESREVGEQEVHRRAMCQTRPAVGAFECADHALALTLTTVLVDSYGETETRSRGDFGGALGRLDFSPTREQPTCGEDPVDGAQVGISEEGRVEMHKGLASVGPTSGASDEENVWGPERESLCLRRQLTAMGIDVADAPLLLGRDDEGTLCGITSDILAYPDEILRIREACPVRCGLRDWELLYSTKRHGLSMNTFFRQVQGRRDSVLVIKDSGGHVFGAFIPFAWKQSSTFYGSGESFVLAVKPTWTQYRWSRQNSMFAITNPKGIMIGGGGSPAIWLDGDFNQGTSGPCMTYNSRCLCARGNGMGEGSTAFTCIHMEVWAAMQDVQFGQHVQLRHRLLEQMTSDRVLSYLRNLRRQVNANREGGDGVNVESLVLHGAGLQGEGSEGRESQPVGFLEHEMEAHEADHEGVEAENIARENSPVTGGAVAGGTVAAGGTLSSAMSMLRSAMGFRFGGGAKQSDGKGGKQNDVGSISKVAGMSLRSFSISKPFGVVPAGATTGQDSGINEEKAGTGDSTRAAGSERAQRDADETGVALFERPPSLQTPDGLNLVVQDRVASSRVQEPGVQEGQQGLQSGAHDGVRGNFNAGVEGQGEGNCVVDDAAAAEGKETPTKPNATASSSALQRWSEIMVYLPDSVADMISPPASPACGPLPSDMGMMTVDSADLAADRGKGVEMSATGERNADCKSGPDDAGDVETRRSRKCALWSRDDVPLLQSSLVCPLSLPAVRASALRAPTRVNMLVLNAPALGLMVFTDSTGEWLVGMKVKINLLQEHLHIAYRQSPWESLYSATRDGASITTLLRLVKGRSPCFLVIKDSAHHVFGAYLPEGLRQPSRRQSAHGAGQALLFSLHPAFRVFGSKVDNYLTICEDRGIALGGVVGHDGAVGAGLHLDCLLTHGSSTACATFGTKDSVASAEEFESVQVEVWALTRATLEAETGEDGSGMQGAALLGRFT